MQLLSLDKIISLIFIFISIILSFIICRKSLKSYRESKSVPMLLIAIGALFIALAMIFLVGEQALLTETLFNAELGILCGGIATALSGGAATAFDAFALKMVFPKRAVVLTILAGILATIYVVFWISDPSKVAPPYPDPEAGEIIFGTFLGIYRLTPLLSFLILVPLMTVPIFILLYFSIKVRKESSLKSKRSGLLGLGGLCLAIAYTVELLGIDPWVTTGFRALFLISSILFYIALFKIKGET